MWIFILLYIVGLITSQATGKGNSTQMYFAKLIIDKNAIGNITELLRPFVSNTNLYVDDLRKTTTCKNVKSGTECNCEPDFRWSDKLCESKKCCDNDKCTFPQGSSRMCVSNETVTVTGSVALKSNDYEGCLAANNTDSFTKCNEDILKKLKRGYSTLSGFDVLTITEYRIGSIIAEFEMTIAYQLNLQNFLNTSEDLSKSLPASLVLETTGVVHLSTPANPVHYKSSPTLRCAAQEDLHIEPEWQLKRDNTVFEIHNGTESTVILGTKETEVRLKDISENWEGEYTCSFKKDEGAYTISHKASFVMNLCLLPDIDISTTPGFLDCRKSSNFPRVTVQCEIEKSNEKYYLSWEKHDITVELSEKNPSSANGILVHAAETFVNCNSTAQTPTLTCTFKNICNQTKKATVDVNIIHDTDQVCEADGDWGVTKAGFTAVLKCKDAAGKRQRTCRKGPSQGEWDSEVSACVNWRVQEVLEKATVVDIGLGSLDGNAASVFSLLENVTNNSQAINTFANVNASVQVLLTLSEKSELKPNDTASRDFLEASSNLLEKSLNKSWKPELDSNSSLADIYLSAVENLVQKANLTGVTDKKNIQVEAQNCSTRSACSNTVFNVTIVLNSQDPGNVKSVGFQNLEKYLPYNADKFEPNSIVVSTTAERKQPESLEVKITFGLLKPRPRNTELKCMFWDNSTKSWSDYNCKWDGPATEGRCVCRHLSSFAILMSKYPLEVPGTEVITNTGMAVSILSLVINIAIELTVWSAVVKTNTLYLRHTAHINIAVCLLVADCCFLASTNPKNLTAIWCQTLVVLKHFCYLSMFFWMLCLSSTLLHQTVFLFHTVSKKNYLRFSLVLGYVCPLLIVAITLLAYQGGNHLYFSTETCWLVYAGTLKGSIYAFIFPVGTIIFINVFSMVVVIMKLLDHPKNAEASLDKDKKAAKTVMRSVILLTPVFGLTWILGFAVFILDLTSGFFAYAVNYAFTLLNAFQGLFILLITCLGEKLTRDALLNRLKIRALTSTVESSKLDSTSKN